MATSGLTAFLSAGWTLLEVDPQAGAASLIDAWTARFGGDPPHFSEDGGDATIGFHAPSHDPRERYMLIGRTANDEALQAAIRLLVIRHDLTCLHPIGRPRPDLEDWTPDLTSPHPVTHWPSEEREIKDSLVIGHHQQSLYIHRAHSNPSVLQWRLTANIHDALTFSSVPDATRWLERKPGHEAFVLTYRSSALAALDQAAVENAASGHGAYGSGEEQP